MGFYNRIVELCRARGISLAAVARDIGLSNSVTTYWKRGAIPKGETLQKLADYFGVSVNSLIPPDFPPLPDDLAEILLNNSTGTNIVQLRKAKKLTQKNLSEKTGIPLKFIQSYERETGGYFPTEDDLSRLAEVFRVDPKYIKGTGVTQEWMVDTHSKNCFQRVSDAWCKLNVLGHDKLAERAEELAEIPRYRAETPPAPPPAPPEDTDPAPTAPPPESPQEGG